MSFVDRLRTRLQGGDQYGIPPLSAEDEQLIDEAMVLERSTGCECPWTDQLVERLFATARGAVTPP